MGLYNNFMIEKITHSLGPLKGVPVAGTHFCTVLSAASVRSRSPLWECRCAVNVLCVVRMGSFHRAFRFWKVARSGILQMGWFLRHCDLHLEKNCFTDIMLNEKECCCGEDPTCEITVPVLRGTFS